MKTYTGGCHCGKVQYEVQMDLNKVISCNCSHCSKQGLLLTFVPSDRFALISGDESLTEYRFNKKFIQHLFCKICGVESFARGADPKGNEMIAVNVRCLDDIDVEALTLTPFDGKSL